MRDGRHEEGTWNDDFFAWDAHMHLTGFGGDYNVNLSGHEIAL